jgi:hypothetical protein
MKQNKTHFYEKTYKMVNGYNLDFQKEQIWFIVSVKTEVCK